MKEIRKFDVLDMKMVLIVRKSTIDEAYIFPWWVEGNLPLKTGRIRLWNKWGEDNMLKEEDEEV